MDANLDRPPVQRSWQLRKEMSYHLVALAVAITVIVLSFVMRSVGQEMVFLPGASFPLPPSCTAQQVFGIDCPGCGLTRSFISISAGEWQRAWNFNRVSFLVYLFVVGQIPWRLYQLSRIMRDRFPVFSPWLFTPLFVICCLLLFNWVLKLSGI